MKSIVGNFPKGFWSLTLIFPVLFQISWERNLRKPFWERVKCGQILVYHKNILPYPIWEQGQHEKYENMESASITPCKGCKMFHTGSFITLPSVLIFKLETERAAHDREEDDFRRLCSVAWIHCSSTQWPFSRIKTWSTGQCGNCKIYNTVSVQGVPQATHDQWSKLGGEEKTRIKVKQDFSLAAVLGYRGGQFQLGDFKSLCGFLLDAWFSFVAGHV